MLDWKLRKGAIGGQKVLHTSADYQDDLVTIAVSSTGMGPVISTPKSPIQTLIFSISSARRFTSKSNVASFSRTN